MRGQETAGEAARQAVLEFVRSINEHDVERICSALSEDHTFTDGLGQVVRGRAPLREAWAAYFTLVPDYDIVLNLILCEGRDVGLFGSAGGTVAIAGEVKSVNAWTIPFAARAVVDRGEISEWQIYCDNEQVRQILRGS